jgi:hypothetical protein
LFSALGLASALVFALGEQAAAPNFAAPGRLIRARARVSHKNTKLSNALHGSSLRATKRFPLKRHSLALLSRAFPQPVLAEAAVINQSAQAFIISTVELDLMLLQGTFENEPSNFISADWKMGNRSNRQRSAQRVWLYDLGIY